MVTPQRALDGNSLLLSLAANYKLNDNWAVMSQLIATRASKDSPLHFLDQDVRLGATVSYSF
jgi:outer membrane scaffolding protein for murein synthesis (MipA/OmpV family)